LAIGIEPGDWAFSIKKNFYIRNCLDSDFNYFDNGDFLDARWIPSGPWSSEVTYKDYSRQYYDKTDTFQSRDFLDRAGIIAVQREVNENFSLKLEGSYNNRQFNRYLVVLNGGEPLSSTSFPLQTDETWTGKLSGHLYLGSILQDFSLEHQRTDSNSYGFSNTVESFSWAAVVRPAPSFYLQLFFRLFSKVYDSPPLTLPDLQIGYVDEDSQDLLSIKTSWEWSPQWMADISLNRLRTETTQPGQFYIKDILSVEVQRNF
jgi:hypothetical protein